MGEIGRLSASSVCGAMMTHSPGAGDEGPAGPHVERPLAAPAIVSIFSGIGMVAVRHARVSGRLRCSTVNRTDHRNGGSRAGKLGHRYHQLGAVA